MSILIRKIMIKAKKPKKKVSFSDFPVTADNPSKVTEAEREKEKDKTRRELGYAQTVKKGKKVVSLDSNKTEKYKTEFTKKCTFQVNFGLNDEGGEDNARPPEIKEYSLWKVMKKIEADAPEATYEQRKQKAIAIASLRALIYLKLNKEYAAELAYIYSIEKEFIDGNNITMKDSVFHNFRLDANNPKSMSHLDKDLLIWRSPSYPPLTKEYKMPSQLANHLEYCLRFNYNQEGEPWTKQEVLAKLEDQLTSQEILISTIIDPAFNPEQQKNLLENFVSKVKTDQTGCAAERLQGALEYLSEAKFAVSKDIGKLLTEDTCTELKDAIDSPEKYDSKKFADIYLKLFIQLDGQKILFPKDAGEQEEIEISPSNYQEIVEKIRSYLIQIDMLEPDTAKDFYELPQGFWLFNSQNILPKFRFPSPNSNVGILEFDDEKTAECALVVLKHVFMEQKQDEFGKHAKIKKQEGKFCISISEVQYATFLSYKESLTAALQKAGLNIEKTDHATVPKVTHTGNIVTPTSKLLVFTKPNPEDPTTPTAVTASKVQSVSETVYTRENLEKFSNKILAIDSQDPSVQCILVNLIEKDSILIVNNDRDNGNQFTTLYNKKLFDKQSEDIDVFNAMTDRLKKLLQDKSIVINTYIQKKEDNKYYCVDDIPEQDKKGIQYLCEQLNNDVPPSSLDPVIQNYFFPSPPKQKPDPNDKPFALYLEMLLGALASKPLELKNVLNVPIEPLKYNGNFINGNNILSIYLQACRKAEFDLFEEDNNTKYLGELLDEIKDDNEKRNAEEQYRQAFKKLSNGSQLEDFISGKLQLSEPEKEFLAQMGIKPDLTKSADLLPNPIGVPQGITPTLTPEKSIAELDLKLNNQPKPSGKHTAHHIQLPKFVGANKKDLNKPMAQLSEDMSLLKFDSDKLNQYLSLLSVGKEKLQYFSSEDIRSQSISNPLSQDVAFIGSVQYIPPTSNLTEKPELSLNKDHTTKTVANIFNYGDKIKIKLPSEVEGGIGDVQKKWIIDFLQGFPLQEGVKLTATVNNFNPEDLMCILNEINAINQMDTGSKILLKFRLANDSEEFAAIKETIEIHNKNIDKMLENTLNVKLPTSEFNQSKLNKLKK